MSSPAESPSPLVRFFDGFLQERNIKWILAAGVAILLGSSVMMVTSHWDAIGEAWKYLILLGYVGVIHAAGQACYHRLVLHKTGSGLMALTVLLLPLTFVAWHVLVFRTFLDTAAGAAVAVGLLLPNVLLAGAAARRIFAHFLRGTQPTFLASYLVLCLAGAVAPVVAEWGTAAAIAASLAIWAVCLAGAVKVNRHVFWLAEEHRVPRVYGFLPVLLLTAQFLGVFAANFAGAISTPWLGLGLVLVAIIVLMTADALAGVFVQRTGDLVRPLPWSIAVPLVLGAIASAAGVGLACTQLLAPPHLPYALVPTAALAAIVTAIVARRTGQSFFVWLALAGVVLAYNFSPVFFLELARQIVGMAAEAVREERLPYAFYGLTYLPLIGAFTGGAVALARRGERLFAGPLRQLSVVLSGLLLLASFTHPALTLYPAFLVGLMMTVVFALQASLYQDGRLAWAAAAAWLVAATGSASFVAHFFEIALPAGAELLGTAIGAAVLLVVSARSRVKGRACEVSSLIATLGVAGAWIWWYAAPASPEYAWGAAAGIAVLMLVHCLRWVEPVLSAATYGFCVFVAWSAAVAGRVEWQTAVTIGTYMLLAQWVVDYAFARWPNLRVARAFAVVNRATSYGGLTVLLAIVYLPLLTIEPFVPRTGGNLSKIAYLLVSVWTFDAARRSRQAAFTVAGFLSLFALASVTWLDHTPSHQWLPALWAAMAFATTPIVAWLRHRDDLQAICLPLARMSQAVLAAVAIFTLLGLAWPLRTAGAVAVVGIFVIGRLQKDAALRTQALLLANWQLIAAMIALVTPHAAGGWLEVFAWGRTAVVLPVALAAAGSAVVWQSLVARFNTDDVRLHIAACQILTGLMLALSLELPHLTSWQFVLAAATFALLAWNECFAALREAHEARACLAASAIGVAVAYFAWFGVISFGRGVSMFVVLGIGLAAHAAAQMVKDRPRWNVFHRPLWAASLSLPAVAAMIAVVRHFIYTHGVDPAWFGMNSLAMLFAAGFYFWQALESDERDAKRSGLLVLSATITNAALALLWIDLKWTDPQLFMAPIGLSVLLLVEMLRREIPKDLHNPLRYAGALIVLVSPTFDIVGGSWVHLGTLMVLSVVVMLLGIGSRVRVLVYCGTAFLCADLVAMVVRGSIDNANLLWLAGIACGAAVLALGAFCENNREVLLQRMRALSAELETWN